MTRSSSLRIALVSNYLPGGSKIGAGFHAHEMANALSARGHDVTVFSTCGPGQDARYRYRYVDPGPRLRTFRFAWRLRDVDFGGFDVLHAHGDDYWLWRRRVRAHVRTIAGSCFDEALRIDSMRGRVRMTALGVSEVVATAVADRVVCISANTRRWYPWVRTVVPCGVDLNRFHPALPAARSPAPTILFVGTYERRKRGKFLMDVFADVVRPALPDARLWMVCSDAPPAPGVEVLGRLSDEALRARYQQAWLFCLPSTYEGFGLPYVEAMACGTPVVATGNVGAREVLDGARFGVLATDERLGDELVRLLTSPDERDRLAAAGVQRARRYAWPAIVDEYERIYAELLERA